MKKQFLLMAIMATFGFSLIAAEAKVACLITTTAGNIQIEIYPGKAPITAANFLRYVDAKAYDGTTFFRVVTMQNQAANPIKIEVVQGGRVADGNEYPPITHETTKTTGILHKDGAISMARGTPGTASSSFFICVGDQPALDFGGMRNPDGQGFAAFGRVTAGMDVVRKIQALEEEKQMLKNPVRIISIRRI